MLLCGYIEIVAHLSLLYITALPLTRLLERQYTYSVNYCGDYTKWDRNLA